MRVSKHLDSMVFSKNAHPPANCHLNISLELFGVLKRAPLGLRALFDTQTQLGGLYAFNKLRSLVSNTLIASLIIAALPLFAVLPCRIGGDKYLTH